MRSPPTTIPIRVATEADGWELGISSVDVYPAAWSVSGRALSRTLDTSSLHLSAWDSSGPIPSEGGGGSGSEGSFDFRWLCTGPLSPGTEVRLVARLGDLESDLTVEIGAPSWPAHASVAHIEPAASPRWPTLEVTGWRDPESSQIAKRVFEQRSPRVLPDDVVTLGSSVGDIRDHELTFLSAERWGEVWWLHHAWANTDAMFSPLRGDLEVIDGASVTTATQLGGGTGPCGVVYTHGFIREDLPTRFLVRLPAVEDGPPLMEAEIELSST